jgi:transposase
MKAYSMDLRERIVAARRAGQSVESVAQQFGVCTKTVRAYDKRAAQGCLSPTPRRGKARRLSESDHQALSALVQERSDWTMATLSQAWQDKTGQVLPSSTLYDALRRLGMTYKKRVVLPTNAVSKNVPRFVKP